MVNASDNQVPNICGDAFWDYNLTWDTEIPDFTRCFQDTILTLVPCFLFWIAAFVSLWKVSKCPVDSFMPWTLLAILKIVVCLVLLVISTLELAFVLLEKHNGTAISDINITCKCVKVATFALASFLIKHNKSRGIRSSTPLAVFWFIFSICETVIYWSTIARIFYKNIIPKYEYSYILGSVYLPIIYCQFFLSLYYDETKDDFFKKKSPLEDSPFFSYITFHWFNELILKGRKKLLTVQDFPLLSPRLHANFVWHLLNSKWVSRTSQTDSQSKKTTWCTLLWSIVTAFWPWVALASLFQIFFVITVYIPPLLLDKIITFVSKKEDYLWKGYFYCIALFLSDFIMRVWYQFFYFFSGCFALQVKSALNSAIYRKSMKLSTSQRKEYTSGEIVNLIAVDVDKVYDLAFFFTFAFGSPLKIVLTIVFLWQYLGVSCLSGIVIICFTVGISAYISKKSNTIQEDQMAKKDSRLKEMAEVLNGIRVLKLYAWEKPFIEKITSIRVEEVILIRIFQICYAGISFIWTCAPFLIAISSFVTYILIDSKHVLTPTIAFVSLNLLNILRYAMLELPQLSADIVQTVVSLKRLTVFLCAEEQKLESVGNMPAKGDAVTIENAIFSWDKDNDSSTLKGINLKVPKGGFVAIIGSVGSGKSSILSAILGEMHKTEGSVNIQGKIAYVPQQPWILNQTVKNNVLFVTDWDKLRYNTVLDRCCLRPDLQILPGGDETEIGEKGVNLSGGQKQRISLARAVYHNADVYLLDDPLSAVDAHVGKELFENVIGNNGLLQKKTRILVTHSISVLPFTDFVITVKDGQIMEAGTYDELLNSSGSFSEFIAEHRNVKAETTESEMSTSLKNPKILGEKSISTIAALQRSISEVSATSASKVNLIEDEHMEVGEVKRKVFLNYASRLSYPVLIGVLIGYLGQQAFEVSASFWLSKWTSDPVPVEGSQDVSLRNKRIGVYAAFGFSQSLLALGGTLLLAIGAARASKIYHSLMLNSIMRAPMSFFDTTPMGRIISRFGRDMEEIDMNIPMELDGFLACLAASIGTFVVIGYTTPLFLAFLVPIAIFYIILQKIYLITSRQLKRLLSTTKSPILSNFTETIQGVSSIKAYNVEEHFIKKCETRLDTNITCNFYWNCSSRWLGFRLNLIGDLIVLVTSILTVSSKNNLHPSVVGLTLTYALTVVDFLNWLVRTGTELENACVSIERVEEYSNVAPEAPWVVSESYPNSSWPTSGKINFQSYSTRYREGLDLVLQQVTLNIKNNEKIGIVGRTGAGKSSFALALFRIIEPVDGTIEIDGIDVSSIGLHQLRSKLTIIPQDPVLFTGTLRLNLDPNEEYTDEEIWNSLEHAHLKFFVSTLQAGLQHEVAEGGGNLSVGQRQLVCLARALLKKTKILILDEATAAVDVETDSLIQNTIRTEFKDYTVITIAHRLKTILDYDNILVMSSGKIAEIGPPTDLLQNPQSHFYSMARDAGII